MVFPISRGGRFHGHRLLSSARCRSLLSSLKLTTKTLTTLATTTDDAAISSSTSSYQYHRHALYQQQQQQQQQQQVIVPPSLMLFSRSQPDTGFICDPPKLNDVHGGRGRIQIKEKIKLLHADDYSCFGSSQGYLLYSPDNPSPYSILALNPITGNRQHLPRCIPFRGGTGSRILRANGNGDYEVEEHEEDDYFYDYLLNGGKAILSPSHDILVLTSKRYPSFCRLGGEGKWTILKAPVGGPLTDCFFLDGCLHAANHLGSFFVYNLDGPGPDEPISSHLTAVSYPMSEIQSFQLESSKYFVASPDGRDLFFVVRGMNPVFDDSRLTTCEGYATNRPPLLSQRRSPIRAKYFIVFKFFKACGKWKKVDNLGGLSLFVGIGQTLSISAHDFPMMVEPDCVYFTDGLRDMYEERAGDTGVFNVKDGSIHFYELKDGDMELDWPPPMWFVPTSI